MLTSWRLQNFKAAKGPVDLRLSNITILSGLNSSGKSSILQSILLVSQTLANQLLQKPLVLNGYQVQLGTFDSIRTDFSKGRDVQLGFSATLKDRRGRHLPAVRRGRLGEESELPLIVSVDAVFNGTGARQKQLIESDEIHLGKASIRVAGIAQDSARFVQTPMNVDDSLHNRDLSFNVEIAPLSEKARDEFIRSISPELQRLLPSQQGRIYAAKFSPGRRYSGQERDLADLAHFLPKSILRTYDIAQRRRRDLEYEAIEIVDAYLRYGYRAQRLPARYSESPLHARFEQERASEELIGEFSRIFKSPADTAKFGSGSIADLLRWAASTQKNGSGHLRFEPEVYSIIVPLLSKWYKTDSAHAEGLGIEIARGDERPDLLIYATQELITYFTSNVRYLGPLRAEPGQVQGFALSNQMDDVGPRGEHAAAVYHAFADRQVEWWSPSEQSVVTTSLHDAITFWIQHLGIAFDVLTEDRKQSGVSWLIQQERGAKHRTLSSVGVGVSQVLPILVLGLLASKGTLLLIEQPELHLHPRAQARLADFFISLASMGIQALVETHSDALVNQFRLQLVKGGQGIRDQTTIYFAFQDEEGATEFEEVTIDDLGNIENWPEGFFDENFLLEDKIASEVLHKQLLGAGNAPVFD